ncbi:DUF4132 domain-containing protein [Catenulispora subtropica]|uniref:DUF4132 domain-containing protein n=1 Tax=Catenulispora subtropica TaxID=450798 RepID=A0ABN2TDK1_9ACTN
MLEDEEHVAHYAEPLAAIEAAVAAAVAAGEAGELGEVSGVLDALLRWEAAGPPPGGAWTYGRSRARRQAEIMLAAAPLTLREAVIREVRARAVDQDRDGIGRLTTVLAVVASQWCPGRRELLLDLQLNLLHPEPLRSRVREALLTDAATMAASGAWRPPRGADSACALLVGRLDEGERRTVARWVMALRGSLWSESRELSRCRDDVLGGTLAKRRLGWSAEEALGLLRSARHGHAVGHPEERSAEALNPGELRFALPAAEQLSDADLRHLATDLRVIVDDLEADRLRVNDYAMGKTAPRRLKALLDRAAPAAVAPALPEGFLGSQDGFAIQARADLADVLADPAAAPLLLHCPTLTSVRATATWLRRCRELGRAYPQAVDVLRRVLRLVVATEVMYDEREFNEYRYVFLRSESAAFVRGAVWAYTALAGSDEGGAGAAGAAELLGDLAVHCGRKDTRFITSMVESTVANAAVAALSTLDSPGALDQLRRVQGMARHRTFQKFVASALDAAALRSGLTREQVIERGVPDHGVDATGRFEVRLGEEGFIAAIVVGGEGAAAIEYARDGKVVRSLPAAVRDACADDIKALKARLKEVQATLRTERDRIEAILATDRTWTAGEWVTYYLAHPLVAPIARRLIWEVGTDPDGPWTSGLPQAPDGGDLTTGWRLRSADGTTTDVSANAVIRLWHPVRADLGDTTAWRAALTDAPFRQPFKQAFRERYLLTPAEEATVSYSNRFAGHILRYGRTKALTVARGWSGLNLGAWSSGASGEAIHEFPGTEWRARFFLETVTVTDLAVAELCSTDQVRFERKEGRTWQLADLVDVPAGLLSEGLRDVDLFVAVASIGADPNWTDRGEARHAAYWHEYSFGALPESAVARRETLARLLPRTRIADRVEVGERFVRVRGDLRTYKIHLGSGNVLMEPDDTYLCIVSARSEDAGKVFLPFEEDGVLSLIVSKAFLLAADAKITDPTILRQFPAR